MNRVYTTLALLLITLLMPPAAFADFRRTELKVQGMD